MLVREVELVPCRPCWVGNSSFISEDLRLPLLLPSWLVSRCLGGSVVRLSFDTCLSFVCRLTFSLTDSFSFSALALTSCCSRLCFSDSFFRDSRLCEIKPSGSGKPTLRDLVNILFFVVDHSHAQETLLGRV